MRVNEDPTRDLALARAALAAARAVPGVIGISSGNTGVARVYGLDGRTAEGVMFRDAPGGLDVEIHLVVDAVPFAPLFAHVSAAVAGALGALGAEIAAVDVCVDALSANRFRYAS